MEGIILESMREKLKINNKTKQILQFLFTFLLIAWGVAASAFLIIGLKDFNGDNYFMFEHAKRILSEGFTNVEPLTMHEGLSFMYPQWLFAVIIYFLKSNFGNTSVMIFMMLLYFAIYFMVARIALIICKERKNILPLCVIVMGFFSISYHAIRPYIATVLLLFIEVYAIESYLRTKKMTITIIFPILSILQINIHNSLWVSLFLVLICYAGEWVIEKLSKNESLIDVKWILTVFFLMLFSGLINPYGYRYIVYIFVSLESLKPLFAYISELQSPSFSHFPAFYYLFLIDIAILAYTIIIAKKEIPYRFLFMFSGFSLMSMMALRNIIFFTTVGQIPIIYCGQYIAKMANGKILARVTLASLFLSFFISGICVNMKEHIDLPEYSILDWAKENIGDEGGTMLTSFNTGSYAEYLGYKAYIDARAEIFGIKNNKKADIAKEYVEVMMEEDEGKEWEFMEKYKFDYVLAEHDKIQKIADKDDNYVLICGKGSAKLYERKESGS